MNSHPFTDELSSLAQARAEVILQVVAGSITATEAAKRLDVSRKTFYKWLNRAMTGMVENLEDTDGGRPADAVDEEKEQLRKEKAALEEKLKLMEMKMSIHEQLGGTLNDLLKGKTPPIVQK